MAVERLPAVGGIVSEWPVVKLCFARPRVAHFERQRESEERTRVAEVAATLWSLGGLAGNREGGG